VLWLFGDSIFRGFAGGRFPDEVPVEEAALEPLWALRSPSASMNLLCAGMGLAELDPLGTATCGKLVACYVGPAGQPDRVTKGLAHIERLHDSGCVREGDAIAMLDAGAHTEDPDLYEEQWFRITTAASRPGVSVILCNSFDNLAAGPPLMGDGSRRELFMFELPFKGSASGLMRSHNEATRRAAARAGVRFLNAAALIDDWRALLWERYHLDVYRPDGIHLNPWGQMRLAAALFRAVRPYTEMRPTSDLQLLARTLRKQLNFRSNAPEGSPAFTRDDAAEVVRLCHEEW
jgi:hypothetical protein